MKHYFQGRDFLGFKDLTREEIKYIMDLSLDFKKKWTRREPHRYLEGQVWAALFEKNSTRTRNAYIRSSMVKMSAAFMRAEHYRGFAPGSVPFRILYHIRGIQAENFEKNVE